WYGGFVAPAGHVLGKVAGSEALRPAFDDLADRAAVHRLAELERRDVAFHVVHPPAHVRIDREPKIADANHAVGERWERDLTQLEIVVRGKPLRAADQVPCARHARFLPQKRPGGEGDRTAGPRLASVKQRQLSYRSAQR